MVPSEAPARSTLRHRILRCRRLVTRHPHVAVFATVAIARWLFAADRRVFHVVPDELAVAGTARWVSGSASWNMLSANTWQPGLSFLLAPLFWVTDDPETLYRAMIAVNVLIGALAAVVLARLLARISRLDDTMTAAIAAVVSLTPAAMSASAHVWAEPLVSLLFLTSLTAAVDAVERERASSWLVSILAAGAGFLAHSRLLPLIAVSATMAVAYFVRRREWRWSAASVGAAVTVFAAVRVLSGWVFSEVWEATGSENTVTTTVSKLRRPTAVLDALVGQVWYQLATTGLLIAFGAVALTLALAGRETGVGVSRADATLVVSFVVPLVATSVAFMADRNRPDHLVYGRYNDAILPIVVALGATWLVAAVRARDRSSLAKVGGASALVTLELGFLVRQLHGTQLSGGGTVKPMIAGIAPVMGGRPTVPVMTATLVGLAAGAVVVAAASITPRNQRVPAVAIGVLILGGALALHRSYAPDLNALESADEIARFRDELAAEQPLGIALVPESAGPALSGVYQISFALTYEWYLPGISLAVDGGLEDDVGPYVIAPQNDLLLGLAGAELVWTDPDRGLALWREPGDERP